MKLLGVLTVFEPTGSELLQVGRDFDLDALQEMLLGEERDHLLAYRQEALDLFHERHAQIGCDYQPLLYALLRAIHPKTVVETGVRTGVSTFYALSALKANGAGSLWSCDPLYKNKDVALERLSGAEMDLPDKHRWTFVGERSAQAFAEAPEVWDVFVHDSDHGYANVLFELEEAWKRVPVGGLVVVDNPYGGFNEDKHQALADFFALHPREGGYNAARVGDTVFMCRWKDAVSVVTSKPCGTYVKPDSIQRGNGCDTCGFMERFHK